MKLYRSIDKDPDMGHATLGKSTGQLRHLTR